MDPKVTKNIKAGTVATATTPATTSLSGFNGKVQKIIFQNLDGTNSIYIKLDGTAATNANYTDQIVLTPTSGALPRVELECHGLPQMSFSTASSAGTPTLYYILCYL